MANYWYLSKPCSKRNAASYRNQWLQELAVNGERYGYISSFDDGSVQHHYALDMNGDLAVFDGSIDDFFTSNSIFIGSANLKEAL